MMDQELVRRFADLTDDALLRRLQSGDLTELAESIARDEAKRRGLAVPAESSDSPVADAAPSKEAPPDFVQFARYLKPMEAYLLQGRLQAEGIDAHLSGVSTVETNPLWFNAMGGVRIFVPRSQYAQAKEVLTSEERGDFDLDDGDPDEKAAPASDERKWQLGWVLLVLPCLVFAIFLTIQIWTPRCPPNTLCMAGPETVGDYLFKLSISVASFGPAAFAIRYLGLRFKLPPAS